MKDSLKNQMDKETLIFTPFYDHLEKCRKDLKYEIEKSRRHYPGFADTVIVYICEQMIKCCQEAKEEAIKYQDYTLEMYKERVENERHSYIMRELQADADNAARRSGIEPK